MEGAHRADLVVGCPWSLWLCYCPFWTRRHWKVGSEPWSWTPEVVKKVKTGEKTKQATPTWSKSGEVGVVDVQTQWWIVIAHKERRMTAAAKTDKVPGTAAGILCEEVAQVGDERAEMITCSSLKSRRPKWSLSSFESVLPIGRRHAGALKFGSSPWNSNSLATAWLFFVF